MPITLNDNLRINVGNPIDAKYLNSLNQPYSGVTEVNTTIPQSQRYVGLTVNINNVEYWYKTGVTDGALVIKDNSIATSGLTTAINGLTKTGTTVMLGGPLIQNTSIIGNAFNLNWGVQQFNITGATEFNYKSDLNKVTINACNVATGTLHQTAGSYGLILGNNNVFSYCGDYSANYDCLSIPNVGWVTGLTSTSGVQTAINGLTKTGTTVMLGGPLIQNTSIIGNYTLNFSGGSKLNSNDGYQISGSTILKLSNNSASNIGIGCSTLMSNTTGINNIGIGSSALNSNLSGNRNIGVGTDSLKSNTTGSFNVAIGSGTLTGNTTGPNNIAIGNNSLCSNTIGNGNVSIGSGSMRANVCGNANIALGLTSINALKCGDYNIGIGSTALGCSLSGSSNIGLGHCTLFCNINGCYNLAIGNQAGACNITGSCNIFIGNCAGYNEINSNRLHIANKSTESLIYGEFDNKCIIIHGALKISGDTSLLTTPPSGTENDSLLAWNSIDKQVKIVSSGSVGDKNQIYSYTAITSNVTLTTGTSYVVLVNPASPITITLPSLPNNGRAYRIKDISGSALTNNITVDGNGKNIDGSPTALINTDYGAIELLYDGSDWFNLSFVN